jgi:chromosome segregation ATPase
VQAEQELLENRILELEDMIARLRQEAAQRQAQIDHLEQTVEAQNDMQIKLQEQLQSAEVQIQEGKER